MAHEHYVKLRHPQDLDAWEPRDGYALVACRVMVLPETGHAPAVWESRTYEFQRLSGYWLIDTNPGVMRREVWHDVVDWLCRMHPADIEILTTV